MEGIYDLPLTFLLAFIHDYTSIKADLLFVTKRMWITVVLCRSITFPNSLDKTVLCEYTHLSGNFTTVTRILLGKIPTAGVSHKMMSYVYDKYERLLLIRHKTGTFSFSIK